MNKKIVVIEDDIDLLDMLIETLVSHGYEVHGFTTVSKALDGISSIEPNLILSDFCVEKSINGLELIRTLRQKQSDIPVVVMSAFGTVPISVNCIKMGAVDFLCKPFDIKALIQCIEDNIAEDKSEVVFCSDEMKEIQKVSGLLAKKDTSVLLSGESGVGKEVVAQYIHNVSSRADHSFVAVNCAAIPDNMLEAILFGYEKGAYTGAVNSSAGKFEIANKGTILLDEISEMPLALQVKLLRVLQEKEVERIGGKKPIKLDVRVIAATNKDLKKEVDAGHFREDLYYRINVFPIKIPALRDRKDDITPLSESILQKYRPELVLGASALKALHSYEWPGNIREMDNIIQRISVLAEELEVTRKDVEYAIYGLVEHTEKIEKKYSNKLKNQEAETILSELKKNNGSRTITASRLGLSPRTLRYKLAKFKELGFDVPTSSNSGKE